MSQPEVLLVGGTKMVERHLRKALPEGTTLKVLRTMEQAIRRMAEQPTELLVLGPSMRRSLAMVTTIRRDSDQSLGLVVVYRDDQRENVKRHLKGRYTADAYVMQSKVSKEIRGALEKGLLVTEESMITAIDELHEIEELEEVPVEAVSTVSHDAEDVQTVQMDVVVGDEDAESEDATQVMEVIHSLEANADGPAEGGEGGEVLGAFELSDEGLEDEVEDLDVIDEIEEINDIEEVVAFEGGADTDVVEIGPELVVEDLSDEDAEFSFDDEITVPAELVSDDDDDDLEEIDADLLEELEPMEDSDEGLPTESLVEGLSRAAVQIDVAELEDATESEVSPVAEEAAEGSTEVVEEEVVEIDSSLLEDVAEDEPADAPADSDVEPDAAMLADMDKRRGRVRKQSSIEVISSNLSELSQMLSGLQQATAEAARLEKDNAALREQLEGAVAAADDGSAAADLTQAQADRDDANKQLEAAQSETEQVRGELTASQTELEAAQQQIGELQAQLKQIQEQQQGASARAIEAALALRKLADTLQG